jgi:uncharacterized protein YbjT (DUF2867 family)
VSKVLLAGATGLVGFEVLKLLHARGESIRTVSRTEANAAKLKPYTTDIRLVDVKHAPSVRGVCDGIDIVFSSLGASLAPVNLSRESFFSIDYRANLNLLAEAKTAGVKRFIYVSVFTAPAYAGTAYIRAHEAFVDALKESGLSYTIVRPTGIFQALGQFVSLAQIGVIPLFGNGQALSNPVHEMDVALACANVLEHGPAEIEIGGSEVLSRQQIAALAFDAAGKIPRYIHVPRWVMLFGAIAMRLFHRRIGELLDFVVRVSTTDAVAPQVGSRRLSDYFSALASSRIGKALPR